MRQAKQEVRVQLQKTVRERNKREEGEPHGCRWETKSQHTYAGFSPEFSQEDHSALCLVEIDAYLSTLALNYRIRAHET